jgi:cell division protein FtsA
MDYPELEILDAVTQEYKVDQQYQLDPVGIQSQRLEGNFLNILWRKSFYKNLNKCFDQAGIAIAEMYLAPLALADSVLSEAEKRSGCVLVDLGYDTTTVSVYHKNILRHLAVIPIGANNITKDIASLQMEESEAEKMKLKYASAFTSNNEIDNTLMLPIDPERQVESRKFIEIVEGRLEEIIENVWFQVPSEYTDKLLGGIILTGGGANMKNIDVAFRNHTHIDKIRIANFVSQTINSTISDINAHNAEFNTVLGLLAKGDMNCAGDEIHNDLFGTTDTKFGVNDQHKVRQPNEIAGTGVVRTEAEKQKAEEEERLRKEQEEERLRKEQEEEAERLRKEKKENSTSHKFMRGLKKFFTTIVSAEEDV